MAEFSAHNITLPTGSRYPIVNYQVIYVAPWGNDAENSGTSENSPFRTPARAIEFLGDKVITESGFVTIKFAPGIYDLDDQLVFDHAQGNRVAFVGADPEILVLQYVSDYVTTGFTADGYAKYYSGVTHGITLACVRPSDSTVYSAITPSNPLGTFHKVKGCGVIIEDFDLVHSDNYNPAYYYGSYPFNARNNLPRQGSILGSHVLLGVSGASACGSIIRIQSSIRDDWFSLPHGNSSSWGLMFGNAQSGVSYYSATHNGNSADLAETTTNAWFQKGNTSGGLHFRTHFQSNVPVGYFGLNATTGVPDGASANIVGATFPFPSTAGQTANFTYRDVSGIVNTNSDYANRWFTATGPAMTFLNDGASFGKNYHAQDTAVSGRAGIGSSGSWRTVNANRVTVKILPTVFRRFGNILKIGSGGLRKIKNIFFDGMDMPSHYKLVGNSETGYSNKYGIYSVSATLGEAVTNEPSGLGIGLFSNCGIKDFHVGFYADRGTDAYLGKLVVSNCTYGILANNRSSISTVGSVCTGMASTAFGAFTSSNMVADRCFASFVGQSHVTLRFKSIPSGTTLDDNSYIPGQTFASPDGKIRGTVWDWDPRDKTLVIAVRTGMFEAADATTQG